MTDISVRGTRRQRRGQPTSASGVTNISIRGVTDISIGDYSKAEVASHLQQGDIALMVRGHRIQARAASHIQLQLMESWFRTCVSKGNKSQEFHQCKVRKITSNLGQIQDCSDLHWLVLRLGLGLRFGLGLVLGLG